MMRRVLLSSSAAPSIACFFVGRLLKHRPAQGRSLSTNAGQSHGGESVAVGRDHTGVGLPAVTLGVALVAAGSALFRKYGQARDGEIEKSHDADASDESETDRVELKLNSPGVPVQESRQDREDPSVSVLASTENTMKETHPDTDTRICSQAVRALERINERVRRADEDVKSAEKKVSELQHIVDTIERSSQSLAGSVADLSKELSSSAANARDGGAPKAAAAISSEVSKSAWSAFWDLPLLKRVKLQVMLARQLVDRMELAEMQMMEALENERDNLIAAANAQLKAQLQSALHAAELQHDHLDAQEFGKRKETVERWVSRAAALRNVMDRHTVWFDDVNREIQDLRAVIMGNMRPRLDVLNSITPEQTLLYECARVAISSHGALDTQSLLTSFESIKREADIVAWMPPGGGLMSYLWAKLLYPLRMKVSPSEDDRDAHAQLARAESAVQAGDLVWATRELQHISGPAGSLLVDWMDAAKQRLRKDMCREVEQSYALLLSERLATMSE
ncbi:MICOS complex subunit MIC60 [Porphyridium purpureum]|uniref:MICOS complex subunit MIC60 n=1 Tax=Porphyridium purpureum TaxID=35688 RepID=A0A5J4YWJ2_PORPP|nr:MICOS complex subunit MIC60 [Porphyridium purpureum]|eukprot:POR4428..scf209_3